MNYLGICNPDVAFDGWAVALISVVFTAIGFGVCKTSSNVKQRQKAGKNAKQSQTVKDATDATVKDKTIICQKQEAGDGSEQNQMA